MNRYPYVTPIAWENGQCIFYQVATTDQAFVISLAALREMRQWIGDCWWSDLKSEAVESLTDSEVVAGVVKHYAGGIEQFLSDSKPVTIQHQTP
jgi:hypothetical protein